MEGGARYHSAEYKVLIRFAHSRLHSLGGRKAFFSTTSIYIGILKSSLDLPTYQYQLKLTLQTSQLEINPGPHRLEPAPVYTTEAELQPPATYYLHSSAPSAPRRSWEATSRRDPLTSLRCSYIFGKFNNFFRRYLILQCVHLTSLCVSYNRLHASSCPQMVLKAPNWHQNRSFMHGILTLYCRWFSLRFTQCIYPWGK